MSDTAQEGAATSAADLLGDVTATTETAAADATTDAGAAPAKDAAKDRAAPAAADLKWLEEIDDPELKGWAQNKGYPNVKELAAAHRGLETILGREKVPLPKDENDQEGFDRVYKALGRPEDKSGYKLAELAGDTDPAFADQAGGWFHEAGLNPRQAGVLAEKWNAFQASVLEQQQQEFQTKSRADLGELQTEWGDKFTANTELARRGARMVGWDKATTANVERVLGTKGMMLALAKIGGGLAEDEFIDGETSKGFGMTPDQAGARLKSLMADKDWSAKYVAGDAEKRAEVERLNRIISGAKAAA